MDVRKNVKWGVEVIVGITSVWVKSERELPQSQLCSRPRSGRGGRRGAWCGLGF